MAGPVSAHNALESFSECLTWLLSQLLSVAVSTLPSTHMAPALFSPTLWLNRHLDMSRVLFWQLRAPPSNLALFLVNSALVHSYTDILNSMAPPHDARLSMKCTLSV